MFSQPLIDETVISLMSNRPVTAEQQEVIFDCKEIKHSKLLMAEDWIREKFPAGWEGVQGAPAAGLHRVLSRVADQALMGRTNLKDTLFQLDMAWQNGVEQAADLGKVAEVLASEPQGTLARSLSSDRGIADELTKIGVEPEFGLNL